MTSEKTTWFKKSCLIKLNRTLEISQTNQMMILKLRYVYDTTNIVH